MLDNLALLTVSSKQFIDNGFLKVWKLMLVEDRTAVMLINTTLTGVSVYPTTIMIFIPLPTHSPQFPFT